MALTNVEILRAILPNIGLPANPDGTYRIGVEDVNSDEILAAVEAGAIDLAALEIINTAIQVATEASAVDLAAIEIINTAIQVVLEDVHDAAHDVLGVKRGVAGLLNSGVLSADTNVKATPGDIYWLSVSDTAALAIEINDSTDDGGTDVWSIDIPADGYGHFIFDPPLECATGIWLDVSTATCKVTIGYI